MQPDFQIGIIGAGFAGIIAALRLQQSGRNSFVIFEKAAETGGTWRDNVYPGCACDVPSHLYSISFAPNPHWTRMYSSQAEIWEYMKEVVQKNDLEKHIRYHAEIIHYEFVEQEGFWELTDRRGNTTTVRIVIAALGPFSRPRLPNLKGIDSFQGKKLHSARWDKSYDLRGKRVAVIGTGASAVQIVPAIAPEVAHLSVFQRNAAWISDRSDWEIPAFLKKSLQTFPALQKFIRTLLYSLLEFRGRLFIGNALLHKFFTNQSLKKLNREVHDPELRRKLTPAYQYGCKRILVADDYWPAFNRPNVCLETAGIAEITSTGIRTDDGKEYHVDAIIFATGFEVADFTTEMKVIGRNGRELLGEWRRASLEAYKGTTISGFPNLAFLLGPNTGLGHSSVLQMMEAQMNYVIAYISLLESQGEKAYLDLKPAIQRAYNEALQRQFEGTVWASGCKSWYLNSNGKITTLYPRLTRQFRRETAQIDAGEYDLVQNQSGCIF